MRRLPLLALVIAATSALSLRGDAQSPGRVLHVPIPGDLPVDDGTAESDVAPPSPLSALQNAARDSHWQPDQPVDERVTHPRATWEPPTRPLDRNTRAPRDFRLSYREVFTPAVAPFKRLQAYDAVDESGQLTIRDPALRVVRPGEPAPAYWDPQRATFVGELQVELSPAWPTPIPGVAGEQRVLSYTTSTDQPVEFAQDSAGNLFARGLTAGVTTLRYVLEAPATAFSAPAGRIPDVTIARAAASVPAFERPSPPAWLERSGEVVAARIGVARDSRLYDGLNQVVDWFRRFQDGELPPSNNADLYTDLALGHVGACRHRAYAMMLTLLHLGIPARYVGNEAHAWVEVLLPGMGWSRIDLGGWDVPLDAQAPSERATFQPQRDPFSAPPEYNNQYSTHPPDHVATGGGASGGDGGASAGSAGGGENNAGAPGASPTNADPAGGTSGANLPPEQALQNSGATPADGQNVNVPGAAVGAAGGAPGAGAAGGAGASSGAAGNGTGASSGAGQSGSAGASGVAGASGTSASGGESGAGGGGRGEVYPGGGDEADGELERTSLSLSSVRADESAGFQAGEAFVRGSMLHVEGDARGDNGEGVAGLVVEIHLVHGHVGGQSLGSTVTRPDGHWDLRLMLPAGLDPGEYTLRAVTSGDGRHAPAAAE